MDRKMDCLPLYVLNAACDDWENIASIRADVETELKGTVGDDDIWSAALDLARNGLLECRKITEEGRFVAVRPDAADGVEREKLWFYITRKGRNLLDANASLWE
jgi:hypothetical protein